jgi:hypothetical protein
VLREEEPVDDYTAAARSCARRKTPSHAGASPSRRPRSSTSTLQRTPHGTDPPASPHRRTDRFPVSPPVSATAATLSFPTAAGVCHWPPMNPQ